MPHALYRTVNHVPLHQLALFAIPVIIFKEGNVIPVQLLCKTAQNVEIQHLALPVQLILIT